MFYIIIIVVLIFMLIPDNGSESYKADRSDCIRKCMSRNRNSRSKCTNECNTGSGVIKWT